MCFLCYHFTFLSKCIYLYLVKYINKDIYTGNIVSLLSKEKCYSLLYSNSLFWKKKEILVTFLLIINL